MINIDPFHVMRALFLLKDFDFKSAYEAFRTADISGEIRTIDDILKIIGVFFPPVALIENDLHILVPVVVWMLQNGHPGEAHKPEGPDNISTP